MAHEVSGREEIKGLLPEVWTFLYTLILDLTLVSAI